MNGPASWPSSTSSSASSVLTTDYLTVTDADALARLLDLTEVLPDAAATCVGEPHWQMRSASAAASHGEPARPRSIDPWPAS